MSNSNKTMLRTASNVSIPLTLMKQIEKRSEPEGFEPSDFILKIILDYLKGFVGAETFAEILVQINDLRERLE